MIKCIVSIVAQQGAWPPCPTISVQLSGFAPCDGDGEEEEDADDGLGDHDDDNDGDDDGDIEYDNDDRATRPLATSTTA
jgi:hypothetical protein